MTNALERYKKECEEMKLAAMVWRLILWHACDEGRFEIPTEQEWLSSELVAAIGEDVTGTKIFFSGRHDWSGQEYNQDFGWQDRLNDILESCEEVFHNKFDGSTPEGILRALLKRFVHYTFHSDHDEKGYTSELKLLIENDPAIARGRSLFIPHREMAMKSIRFLGEQGVDVYAGAMEWCSRIGLLMQPYIARDVAYIEKHYSW